MAGSTTFFVVSIRPLIFEAVLHSLLLPPVAATRDEGLRDDFTGSLHTDGDAKQKRRAISILCLHHPNEGSEEKDNAGEEGDPNTDQELETNSEDSYQKKETENQSVVEKSKVGLDKAIGTAGKGGWFSSVKSKTNWAKEFYHRKDLLYATQKDIRPSEGCGCGADWVRWSILVKKIAGIKVNQKQFAATVVLTLTWFDKRLKQYVEENAPGVQDYVTLEEDTARKYVWMPQIVVANRGLGDAETIFYSMKISKEGRVDVVRQFRVVMKENYDIHAFPFDRQTLKIGITPKAATKHEVMLFPDNDTSRSEVKESLFDRCDFTLMNWRVATRTDPVWQYERSPIERSTGVLYIEVQRRWWGIAMDTLWPDLLIVFVTWLVLFFPPIQSFAMPRAGGSSVGFLTMITYHIRTLSLLPSDDNDQLVWIEFWDECCIYLTITVLGINILTEYTNYHWNRPDLAHDVLSAGRLYMVYKIATSLGTLSIVAWTYRMRYTDVPMENMRYTAWFVRTLLLCSDMLFMTWVFVRGEMIAGHLLDAVHTVGTVTGVGTVSACPEDKEDI